MPGSSPKKLDGPLNKIYANLTQCIHDNLDQEDPQAYCRALMEKTDKQLPPNSK